MRAAAIALFGVVVLLACRSRGPADRHRQGPPDDELWLSAEDAKRRGAEEVPVVEEDLPEPVSAGGRVVFDDQRVQHVVSPVAGRVVRVLAAPGDLVKKGSPLAVLLSPEAASAFSDVEKAAADLAQASAELDRQRKLVRAEAGPRRDLEAAEDAHRKAAAELARVRERAALLRASGLDAVTQELTLRSAVAGRVLARAVSPGMEIQGAYGGGTPAELFTVGDTDRVHVLTDVAENDVARVRVGAFATVLVTAWPGRVFEGEVRWVGPALDPALRTARVRIAVQNEDHSLRPEMLARVTIACPPVRARAVPRKALVTIEGQRFAWVAEGRTEDGRSRYRRRLVRASVDPSQPMARVQDGLTPGDRVLVEGGGAHQGSDSVTVTRRQLENAGLRIEPARVQAFREELTVSARVAFDDLHLARVFSPVSGRVVQVFAEPGSRVKRGDPLVALSSPDVGVAFADRAKAEADRIAAEHAVRRERELVAAHAGARKDLEAATAAFRKAEAELERARQKTRLLSAGTFDAVTQRYVLRSPMDGEVIARLAAPGLEVPGQWSGAGNPVELFTVGSLQPLWLLGEVYEMDVARIRPGLDVTARVPAFAGRVFRGRVDWVSEVIDPATRTARFRCIVDNPEGLLRPEMAPVLTVEIPGRRQLAAPHTAVLRLGDDDVVFVAGVEGKDGEVVFRRRKVVLGDDGVGGTVAIREGLTEGDRVVTSGAIVLAGLL